MTEIYQFLDIEPFRPQVVIQAVYDAVIPVRRPLHGIVLRKPSYANLQILALSPDGSKQWINVLNSSAPSDQYGIGMAQGTSNFFIAQVTHSRDERIQLSQSSVRRYLRVFGDAPDFIEITGVLLNSQNFPWRAEWLRNYDKYMRASRTVESLARIYLTIDDTIYEGHMIRCRVIDQTENPGMSPMAFVMFLTNVIYAPVGGAKLRRDQITSDFDVGASSTEYVKDAPDDKFRGPSTGTSEYDLQYVQDEYGNIKVVSSGRDSSDDVAARICYEQVAALLDKKLMDSNEALTDPSVLASFRETFKNSLDTIRSYLFSALEQANAAYGMNDSETSASNSVRTHRTVSGKDSGGEAQPLPVDSTTESIVDSVVFQYEPTFPSGFEVVPEPETGREEQDHWTPAVPPPVRPSYHSLVE